MRLGIDFDNTIASYDQLMHRWASERGLIASTVPQNKKLIRDALRSLEEGESKWRTLQVYCYGPGMPEAQPTPGVKDFLAECKARGVPVWIVSHKTREANFGPPNVKLRDAAMSWLEAQGFFDSAAFGLERGRVFFEDTRQAKVQRIRQLDLTHFIDDLEETFLEASFPTHVTQILLSAEPSSADSPRWRWHPSWASIQRELFGA
jgi:hypothetical protein